MGLEVDVKALHLPTQLSLHWEVWVHYKDTGKVICSTAVQRCIYVDTDLVVAVCTETL